MFGKLFERKVHQITNYNILGKVQWELLNWSKDNEINQLMVLKLGVATLFRVAKYSFRVAKVYQDCHITLDLL
jgi:hypothetical protein